MNKEMGHIFLRRLGKKRLRPGGKEATDFLIEKLKLNENTKLLEVACNNGLNLSILAKQNPEAKFYGIDLDAKLIEEANEKFKKEGIKNVEVKKANAIKLPYEDETFDYIINEAMLTMLPDVTKEKALKEYMRVLKKGGLVLTHDVAIITHENEVKKKLSEGININVSPMTIANWKKLFEKCGYEFSSEKHGKLTLMTPKGMLKDEGFFNMLKIVFNGLKKENREQFFKMRKTFSSLKDDINYVAFVFKKGDK